MKKLRWGVLLLCIGIFWAAAGLGALLTGDAMGAYAGFVRPPLSPPGWLFPVVWSVLYTLMGVSAYLVYTSENENRTGALKLFALQLAVNILWPLLFFRFEAFWLAFGWLVILWALVLACLLTFRKLSPAAAWLQLPYLLWLTFAGYLNLMTALLNG